MWAINEAHFSFNFGYYTLMAWLPSYFELALGLNVQKSSLLTLIPYLAMMAMTPFVRPDTHAHNAVPSGDNHHHSDAPIDFHMPHQTHEGNQTAGVKPRACCGILCRHKLFVILSDPMIPYQPLLTAEYTERVFIRHDIFVLLHPRPA